MGSKLWLVPAPSYLPAAAGWDADEDSPGPRCGHTLTAVAPTRTRGPRLILFGGATAIEGGASGIRLSGVTNSVHSYDVESKKWCRMHPAGEPPSPRAAHAAAAVGTMVVFQGGIGPAGHSTDDLYVLDLTNDKFKWHRVVVQEPGPGPRYGHAMDLVAQRYLVTVSGNDGKETLSDAWALDTAKKPYRWQKLNPQGDKPSPRMYATASARSDGMLLLCGGRDASGTPLSDAYGLLMHTNCQWEWTLAPGVSPLPRYQHAAVFVGARLHVTGGAVRGGRGIEGEGTVAVLDTAAGVWLDRNGFVTASSRSQKSSNDHDTSLELLRRCRHASASVGSQIYIYGGLKGDILLDDFLVADNSPFKLEIDSSMYNIDGTPSVASQKLNHSSDSEQQSLDSKPESVSAGSSLDQRSIAKLVEASTAEYEVASAVWQAAKEASERNVSDDNETSSQTNGKLESSSDSTDALAPDVRLHPRAVVVAKETVGNLGGLIRQLSLDQFENESRRMYPTNADQSYPTRKYLNRQKSPLGLHKKASHFHAS
ncbi:serine/threonine-protein phosphatase BSL1-like protein [Iris pallida]|uniref:Serine/threonine-protein phosphatase BSL1-like protein n=1 Tax=Iris pallida TaxID=29817 RepID=A0AAX6I5P5_IRIPA|nr:serine/threonine-protein phosphatase BSL1-like protein [Iris pallida]